MSKVPKSDSLSSTEMPAGGPSPEQKAPDEQDTHIEVLMDQWEASYDAGQPIEVDTLCQDHPGLVDEIRKRVEALQSVDRKLKSREHDRIGLEPLRIESNVRDLKFVNAGGLGEVFSGKDVKLHRDVAIKFMHTRHSSDNERRNRFVLEAEVTGRLEHPGVVPLYGVGVTDDDRLFYAMRFIDGETLDDAIERYFKNVDGHESSAADNWVESRRLLNNFVSVCKTIAYAHNRGIVHRDIKPANVMLGRFGETIVVDWGLAVPVERDARFKSSGEQTLMPSSSSSSGSSTGRGAGTPAFMSPEQASELAPTPSSDIYSLGATLFKLLAGHAPISSKSLPEIRSNIIDGKLPAITDFRSDVPKPLQSITYKAMALRPVERYDTALDLARDVERYLADEPISAYEEPYARRLARIARRHRTAAQAAVLGLCACLLIAAVSALMFAGVASREKALKGTADGLRQQNLKTSARFMSLSIANEIDLRWRVLELEASSRSLRTALGELNAQLGQMRLDGKTDEIPTWVRQSAVQQQLQSWLENRYGANSEVLCSSWLICAKDGTLSAVATNAKPSSNIGNNYSHRAYFSGEDADISREDAAARRVVPMRNDVHMSPVFRSTRDDEALMVAFSVPIWSNGPENINREPIGVIASTVEIGHFQDLDQAWLVDSRRDSFKVSDSELFANRGLLLYHPNLNEASGSQRLVRLPKRIVYELSDHDFATHGDFVKEIHDPTDDSPNSRPLRAAIQPIVIRRDAYRSGDDGWFVVATERNESFEE